MPQQIRFWPKVAALGEVLGIMFLGGFLAGRVVTWLGVKSIGELFQLAHQAPADWVALSVGWLQFMLIYYACLVLPAFAVGWWRRRTDRRYYGVTTAEQSLGKLAGLGVIAFIVFGLGLVLLTLARRGLSLGPSASPLTPFLDQNWTPAFWLFLAVASFAVQPAIEELFYRGYCQTRLEEAFGGGGAVVMVACFTVLGHNQYHHLTLVAVGTMIVVLLMNLGLGYVYWRSRSLVPGIIFHGLVNIPTTGVYDFLTAGLVFLVLAIFWRRAFELLRDFSRELKATALTKTCLVATLAAILGSIGFESLPVRIAPLAALVALAVAIFIAHRERRLQQATVPLPRAEPPAS